VSQKPSVGRIVLVMVHPVTNNGADVAPGIITRVWTDEMVNVVVFLDGANGAKARTSVPLHPDREALDAAAAQRDPAHPHAADTNFTAAYWPPHI
jgi:hypothetical protein